MTSNLIRRLLYFGSFLGEVILSAAMDLGGGSSGPGATPIPLPPQEMSLYIYKNEKRKNKFSVKIICLLNSLQPKQTFYSGTSSHQTQSGHVLISHQTQSGQVLISACIC